MEGSIRADLKNKLRRMEIEAAKSILRWKASKEGQAPASADTLEHRAEAVRGQAREILRHRGKNVWAEFKRAYRGGKDRREGPE